MAKKTESKVDLNFDRGQIVDIDYTYSLKRLKRTITGKLLVESDEFDNFVFAGFDHDFPHELQLFFVPDFTITSLETSPIADYRKPLVEEFFELQRKRSELESSTKKQSKKLKKIDLREEKLKAELFQAITQDSAKPLTSVAV